MDRIRIHTYLKLFDTLRKEHRWKAGTDMLRVVALSLAGVEGPDPLGDLERTVDTLKRAAPSSSPLRSTLRYPAAAMIVRRGLDPVMVVEHIAAVRKGFRAHKFRRGGAHEVLAAFMLVLQSGGEHVSDEKIERVGAILARWKEDHPWITGYDDYPLAAMHASLGNPVEEVGRRVEQCYQELRKARFARGNQLQLATHLLTVGDTHPVDAAAAFRQTFGALKQIGLRVGTAQYDETALLVLSGRDPGTVARDVAAVMGILREHRPRPAKSTAMTQSVGLLLWDVSGGDGTGAGEAATLRAVQAVMEAQQAAAMAAVIASTTAASAAAS